jgi:hypothetical protein
MRSRECVVWVMLVVLASGGTGLAGLSDSLMAYYPFNGNTDDVTGNYGPLTVAGATQTNDRFGNASGAYVLDGVDDQLYGLSYDPMTLDPSAQGSFAVAFWFTPTATWSNTDSPYSLVVGNFAGWGGWGILVWPSESGGPDAGKLYFWWCGALPGSSPGRWVELTTTTATWNAGTWYHVAADYSAPSKNLSIWINGVCENAMAVDIVEAQDLAGSPLTIGRYCSGYADMAIDELRFYSRALEPDEIRELAVVPLPGAVLLGGIGLSVSGWLLRKRKMA